jgi:hypothetical protein
MVWKESESGADRDDQARCELMRSAATSAGSWYIQYGCGIETNSVDRILSKPNTQGQHRLLLFYVLSRTSTANSREVVPVQPVDATPARFKCSLLKVVFSDLWRRLGFLQRRKPYLWRHRKTMRSLLEIGPRPLQGTCGHSLAASVALTH